MNFWTSNLFALRKIVLNLNIIFFFEDCVCRLNKIIHTNFIKIALELTRRNYFSKCIYYKYFSLVYCEYIWNIICLFCKHVFWRICNWGVGVLCIFSRFRYERISNGGVTECFNAEGGGGGLISVGVTNV